jgi:uncharacterized protein with PIN domain
LAGQTGSILKQHSLNGYGMGLKDIVLDGRCMRQDSRAEFRFYGCLNDFLPPALRQETIPYRFRGWPGIKDPIEALGVPHTEVELIVVNGRAAGFDHPLANGQRVAVYPVFQSLDIGDRQALREKIASVPRFVLDVNLGKLARRLRLLGFDSLYRNDYRDADIAEIAACERRIVLTRDRRLLHAKKIAHGYWVRAVEIGKQVEEVTRRFALDGALQPFTRCLACNGRLLPVAKADVLDLLEPKTRLYYENFYRCDACGRIYWEGSHVEDMKRRCVGLLRCQGVKRTA